jgi:hypothetical protein
MKACDELFLSLCKHELQTRTPAFAALLREFHPGIVGSNPSWTHIREAINDSYLDNADRVENSRIMISWMEDYF